MDVRVRSTKSLFLLSSILYSLFTPTARRRLAPRKGRRPHFRNLAKGRALGYRPHEDDPTTGTWVARMKLPDEVKYRERALGEADGRVPADGETVLDFDQAVEKAVAWCEDEERKATGLEPRDRQPYTVARAVEDYLDWVRAHRKAPRQVEQVNRAHIAGELGDLQVEDLNPGRLRRWHQKIAATPPRRRSRKGSEPKEGRLETPEDHRRRKVTANRALAVLKAALNMAYREAKVPSDDAWRRVRPFKRVDRPKIRYLEHDEATRLLNACEPDFRRLVRAALLTGCRYGELCAVRVGDFKAEPLPALAVEDSKSGKGRHVYLNESGKTFFEDLTKGRPPGERMFLRKDGEPWGRSHQSRRMKDASESAEIDPPATFHELRHTYASHYLMNGGDLTGLAHQLGHADTRMTTRHYAHLADRWRAEQARQHVPNFGDAVPVPEGGSEIVRLRSERT